MMKKQKGDHTERKVHRNFFFSLFLSFSLSLSSKVKKKTEEKEKKKKILYRIVSGTSAHPSAGACRS